MDAIEPYAEECQCDGDGVYVIRTVKGGTRQYGWQCLQCGKMKIMRRTAMPVNLEIVPYDPAIRNNYFERRQRFYQRRGEISKAETLAKQQQWWERYEEYLNSQQWQDKRQRVLERDGWVCQACRKRRASEVHHLTYNHAFDEPLFDLVSICKVCHRKITEMDRCNRS